MDQKPFDCILLSQVPAYIGIMFYKRGEKNVYLIDVDAFELENATSIRRSLTEDRARCISQHVLIVE